MTCGPAPEASSAGRSRSAVSANMTSDMVGLGSSPAQREFVVYPPLRSPVGAFAGCDLIGEPIRLPRPAGQARGRGVRHAVRHRRRCQASPQLGRGEPDLEVHRIMPRSPVTAPTEYL